MKKISFLILALILVACSPQVTVTPTATLPPPTETPIPTPTLNPDFVAVQNFISDLNENLVLLPDGSVENNGVSIPNLHVNQNGVINILFNNEHVVIEQSQISFDAESGLTIEGYELNDDGEWVVLTPEQEVIKTFDEYGVDAEKFNLETVTITPNEDSTGYSVVDNETGKVILEHDGTETKFEIGFLVDEIVANSCEPTDFRPNANNPAIMEEDLGRFHYYRRDVTNVPGIYEVGTPVSGILINREKQCWAFSEGKYFYYRDVDKVDHAIPLIGLTKDELRRFQFSRE